LEGKENALAVFIDFENLALGFKGSRNKFDISKVLERLVEKGKLIVKRAYADWSRYGEYKTLMHESNIEMIEIPKRSMTGKNSADIHLCVDAMDLAWAKEHIDTFAIVSGDSDFSPLVSKLKENGKTVIGLGMKDSTSNLLMENCDEFIFYEDLFQSTAEPPPLESNLSKKKKEAFQALVNAVSALMRENKEILWSSMIKDSIKRKKPAFSESYYGYRSFSELLEDAAKHNIVNIKIDPMSGTYIVLSFGKND